MSVNPAAMSALGLLFAEVMLDEARDIEDWFWATCPERTSLETAAEATRMRMEAQEVVTLARAECERAPEEEQ